MLCKAGTKQPFVPGIAPMKICFSDSSATGSQQPCDPTAMHRSICSGKMQPPLLSVALQNRHKACVTAFAPMKICCSDRCAVTQQQCTAALVLARCTPHCSVLLCKTGSQQPCVTATAPIKICCSDRCAVIQQQCTAALILARCTPHCSVLLCNRLIAALCQCSHTFENLLLIQSCSDPEPLHRSIGSGKMQPPLLSVALQNRHKAALCHWNCTYEDLLFRQLCNRLTAAL